MQRLHSRAMDPLMRNNQPLQFRALVLTVILLGIAGCGGSSSSNIRSTRMTNGSDVKLNISVVGGESAPALELTFQNESSDSVFFEKDGCSFLRFEYKSSDTAWETIPQTSSVPPRMISQAEIAARFVEIKKGDEVRFLLELSKVMQICGVTTTSETTSTGKAGGRLAFLQGVVQLKKDILAKAAKVRVVYDPYEHSQRQLKEHLGRMSTEHGSKISIFDNQITSNWVPWPPNRE